MDYCCSDPKNVSCQKISNKPQFFWSVGLNFKRLWHNESDEPCESLNFKAVSKKACQPTSETRNDL
jgi:hypothetical protein